MEEYIRRRQNTVANYIATWSLLDLCEVSERVPEVRVGMRWWEQVGLDLEGAQEAEAEAEAVAAEGGGEEEWKRGSKGGLSKRINRTDYTVAIYN